MFRAEVQVVNSKNVNFQLLNDPVKCVFIFSRSYTYFVEVCKLLICWRFHFELAVFQLCYPNEILK